jgi:hypothetical protein
MALFEAIANSLAALTGAEVGPIGMARAAEEGMSMMTQTEQETTSDRYVHYDTLREAVLAERERAERAEAQVAALEARIEALEATMENHVTWYPTCPWGR